MLKNKGFTLVELAVVLVIIGILATIVLTNVGSFTGQARDTRRVADLRNAQVLLNSYQNKTGAFPPDSGWTALNTDLQSGGILASGQSLPSDPSTGGAGYTYAPCKDSTTGVYNHYIIATVLETASSPYLSNSYQPTSIPASCTAATGWPGGATGLDCKVSDRQYCIYF